MTTALLVLLAIAVSVTAGLLAVRAEPRPLARGRAAAIFAVGFLAWPVVLSVIVFFLLFFWDFWLYEKELKKFGEELPKKA